jgi:Ca-activated chloride channel homolog
VEFSIIILPLCSISMNINQSLGTLEFWFIGLFIAIYLGYVGRVLWIANKLNTTSRSIVLKLILRTVYFSLLILSLLDPSFGDIKGTVKAQGKDIFVLMDVSKSMDASDIQPSRLEKAKFELNRLIEHFQGDRIGIIIFSEQAFMLSPLTFDRNATNIFTSSISTHLLPESGTNLLPALELALTKMTKNTRTANNKSKTIVLISDGENFGKYDNAIINEIKKKGINLFVVGIGTENGITIRQGDKYKKDAKGNIVVTKLAPETLKRIAKDSQGEYLEISTLQGNIAEILAKIDQLSNNVIDQRQIMITANKYFYFLIIALFLLGIDILLTVKTFQL